MKLSVITICYNEKNIRKTCESIVGQSWQDFEWIVVDGGSTDGTLDVLNEYRDRIDVLISEPDNGIYNAMNKGIARARGEWLNFMNGGDAFCDKTVLEQVFGGGSHGNATFGAGKQWETAFRLHGRNRMTDGGGGQVQLLRGAGKAALVRNGGKNLAG